jgi:hypothetical protein
MANAYIELDEEPANLEETLDFVAGKIRTMVPTDYLCEHDDPNCLSCGLKRLVENSVLYGDDWKG